MSSIHLLVLIHGMWGNPQHLAELARLIRERHDNDTEGNGVELKVLLAETNRDDSTYDGIDWGGERVAKEVVSEVAKLEETGGKVTRFSVAGYSLGGLVARYLVGILHRRGFFETVTPVNFTTMATPHLGLVRSPQVFSLLSAALGPTLLSRTGEQFYSVDKWSTSGRALLEVMADPTYPFYQGLLKFSHLSIYANAINDVTVPYMTSAIETEDPFAEHAINGIEIELHESYEPIIKSYTKPETPPVKPTVLSLRWFKYLKPDRPLLPPALQLRFPLNVVLYLFLPVLIPLGISVGLLRLALAARSSRARIKLLEEDASDGERLVHILAAFEEQVENATVELIEGGALRSESDGSAGAEVADLVMEDKGKEGKEVAVARVRSCQVLTPLQLQMAAWLNELPRLRKERAFIPRVRNSHAVIVCRDVKRFPLHRQGEGVIRHWADQFVL